MSSTHLRAIRRTSGVVVRAGVKFRQGAVDALLDKVQHIALSPHFCGFATILALKRWKEEGKRNQT